MKKLFLLVVLAGLAYGAWKYLQKVQDTAAQNQDKLKSPSEKALKDFDKEK
jgi:high-affinity Fe2+/Pb2+ permease